ncbi:MAG: hypothetical protein ACI4M1_03990, partial [Christensenellales bacterium]
GAARVKPERHRIHPPVGETPPNSPEAKVGFLGLEKQQKSQTSKKGLPEGPPKAELSGRGETDIKTT